MANLSTITKLPLGEVAPMLPDMSQGLLSTASMTEAEISVYCEYFGVL
jgi:hypothetical protein